MADDAAEREDTEAKIPLRWTRGHTRELVIAAALFSLSFLMLALSGFRFEEAGSVLESYVPRHGVFARSLLAFLIYVGIATFQDVYPALRQHHGGPVAAVVEAIGFWFFTSLGAIMVIYAFSDIFYGSPDDAGGAVGVILFFGVAGGIVVLRIPIGRVLLLNGLTAFVLTSSIWLLVTSILITR